MHMQRGTFEMRTVGFKAADPAKSLSNHEKKTIELKVENRRINNIMESEG